MIYRMIKDPQAIRDFARTLLRSPASFPTISPDRQRHARRRARDGAGKRRALAPALIARRRLNTP